VRPTVRPLTPATRRSQFCAPVESVNHPTLAQTRTSAAIAIRCGR
jgi:hypothetical protein